MSHPVESVKDLEQRKFRTGLNNTRKVAVTVEQDASNPIPTYPIYGDPVNFFGEASTDPDADVEVINETVSIACLRVMDINVSCFVEGKISVLVNGNPVGTARTAPGKPDAKVWFNPFIQLSQNDVLVVKFKARPNSKVAEVESFINACECT